MPGPPTRRSGPPQGPAEVDTAAKQLNTPSVPPPLNWWTQLTARRQQEYNHHANAAFDLAARAGQLPAHQARALVMFCVLVGVPAGHSRRAVETLRRTAHEAVDRDYDDLLATVEPGRRLRVVR